MTRPNERRTVKIDSLKALVNGMLANSDDSQVEGRESLAILLTTVLMDANAYHGFRYLDSAGVKLDADSFDCDDESRRHYS